jgi:hypothetical protein
MTANWHCDARVRHRLTHRLQQVFAGKPLVGIRISKK